MEMKGTHSTGPFLEQERKQLLESILRIKRDYVGIAPVGSPRPAPFNWSRPQMWWVLYGQQEFLITHVWGSPTLSGGGIQDSPSICPWSIID
jgi:hypothetical protein